MFSGKVKYLINLFSFLFSVSEEISYNFTGRLGFSSQKNWIYSPCQVKRSDLSSEVIKKIDETIETIKKEKPIAGD